jgi:hypothetical protein
MTIIEAKQALTIATLANKLYPGWRPGKSCRRPWGEDRNPSFSVYEGFQKWKDHATGEGGDAIDFLQRALNLSKTDACRKFIELAGGSFDKKHEFRLQPTASDTPSDSQEKKSKRAGWPEFDLLSQKELESLAELRGLPIDGPRWAAVDGVLRGAYSKSENARCWIVVSACGLNAQARRLDGKPFEYNGNKLKSKTLPGSIAQIPVGRFFDARWPFIVVVEGGPDIIAAYAVIYGLGLLDKVSVCGMLGAGMKIPACALAAMAGRRVRILQHNDSAGYNAADAWAIQLHSHGANVDVWTPTAAGSDLNDVLKLPQDAREQEIAEAFNFAKGGEQNACS